MTADALIDKLYAVADDHDTAVLDRLRDAAGLTWECYGTEAKPCRWTNQAEDRRCGRCGRCGGEQTDRA